MITKEDLIFVRDFYKKDKEMRDQLEHLREKVDVHSVQYDKILAKGGEHHDRFAEHAAAVDELEHRYASDIEKFKEKYMKLAAAIEYLPPDEMQLVKLRYQFGYSWKKVRQQMHYSEAQIFRVHKSAIDHLKHESL